MFDVSLEQLLAYVLIAIVIFALRESRIHNARRWSLWQLNGVHGAPAEWRRRVNAFWSLFWPALVVYELLAIAWIAFLAILAAIGGQLLLAFLASYNWLRERRKGT